MVRKLETGKLYVIATPIGNKGDISKRCIEIFNEVHCIAAEDTRNSSNLLSSYNVKKQMVSFHEHNELKVAKRLIKRIQNGDSIALISDAGTPCINDPGYRLVLLAHENGITVSPVPGPSSIVSALSVSGLPSDRFVFEGFLPSKRDQRKAKLEKLAKEERTLIFLVSVHKIRHSIEDMILILGGERLAFIGREMTKLHEQCIRASLNKILFMFEKEEIPKKGEFVLIVDGEKGKRQNESFDIARRLLTELIEIDAGKKSIDIVTKTVNIRRNDAYKLMIQIQNEKNNE